MIFSLSVNLCLTPNRTTAAVIRLDRKSVEIKKGETVTLKIRNNKKKAKWTITSGKKYIRLSSKKKASVTIKGIRKGTSKVQCRIGKKKWYCKVRVTAARDKKDTAETPTTVPTVKPSEMPTEAPTTVPTEVPLKDASGKYSSDVAALQKLIKQQKERGAEITDNIDDEHYYKWNDEGRLVSVRWGSNGLSGDISFASLPALTNIYCGDNYDLNTLDIRQNKCLVDLNCHRTGLIALDISSNTELETVCANDCFMMKSLNTGQNKALKELVCWGNSLTLLDVQHCTSLQILGCGMNHLTALDVSKNVCLKELYCQWNELTSLDISQNTNLVKFACDNNELTALDISKNVLLETLSCQKNQLEMLDISHNPELWGVFCYQNKIKELNLSENPKLLNLNCSNNQLNQLDVTCCPEICMLNCDKNPLTALTIRGCKKLNNFSCEDTLLTKLDVTDTKVSRSFLNLWGIEIIDEEENVDKSTI